MIRYVKEAGPWRIMPECAIWSGKIVRMAHLIVRICTMAGLCSAFACAAGARYGVGLPASAADPRRDATQPAGPGSDTELPRRYGGAEFPGGRRGRQ